METQADLILESALSLPPNERAAIAASLLESLDKLSDEAIEAHWSEEIKRRIEQIDKGKVTLVPWDQVMQSMQGQADG